MLQVLTAKIQVFPTQQQKQLLLDSMNAFRDACNTVSQYVYNTKELSMSRINEALYYDLRKQFKLPSQMTQSAIRAVIAAYKSMKSNGHWELANFKSEFINFVWNQDYSLQNDLFSINSLSGRVKVPYINKGLQHYFYKSVYQFGESKLLSRKGKFYLHISVKYEVPDIDESSVSNIVGVDRGINFIATAYDSKGKTNFYSGRQIKNKKSNYRRLRRELQQVNTRSAKRRLKQVSGRENRWMSDVNHCLSKALVLDNPAGTLFVLEDLKGISEKVLQKRRDKTYRAELVSWAYFDLESKLVYKANRRESRVVKVSPAYTSQKCPKCGHTEKGNRDKKRHLFTCKCCGYKSNDDRIAAMNLYHIGTVNLEYTWGCGALVSVP